MLASGPDFHSLTSKPHQEPIKWSLKAFPCWAMPLGILGTLAGVNPAANLGSRQSGGQVHRSRLLEPQGEYAKQTSASAWPVGR